MLTISNLCTAPRSISVPRNKESPGYSQWVEKEIVKGMQISRSAEDFVRISDLLPSLTGHRRVNFFIGGSTDDKCAAAKKIGEILSAQVYESSADSDGCLDTIDEFRHHLEVNPKSDAVLLLKAIHLIPDTQQNKFANIVQELSQCARAIIIIDIGDVVKMTLDQRVICETIVFANRYAELVQTTSFKELKAKVAEMESGL